MDSSVFSNTLLKNAKLYSETHRKDLDPESILYHAYEKLVGDAEVTAGGSTACIASLVKHTASIAPKTEEIVVPEEDKGSTGFFAALSSFYTSPWTRGDPLQDQKINTKYTLEVCNLGDSGAMVIRNSTCIYRAHEKVHGLNAPFQLSLLPESLTGIGYSDHVADAVRESVVVKEGDLVVLGTDGLFDNRFNTQLCQNLGCVGHQSDSLFSSIPIIGDMLAKVISINNRIDYTDPYRVTQREIKEAFKAACSKEIETPWSMMLQAFGVKEAMGGKVDDITLVLARVMRREDQKNITTW